MNRVEMQRELIVPSKATIIACGFSKPVAQRTP
jgi:hypothetical protein